MDGTYDLLGQYDGLGDPTEGGIGGEEEAIEQDLQQQAAPEDEIAMPQEDVVEQEEEAHLEQAEEVDPVVDEIQQAETAMENIVSETATSEEVTKQFSHESSSNRVLTSSGCCDPSG